MNAPTSAASLAVDSSLSAGARTVCGPVERLGSFVRNGHSVFVVQFWQDAERHVIDPMNLVGAGMAGARESVCAMLAVLQPGERLELQYGVLEGAVCCIAVRGLPSTSAAAA